MGERLLWKQHARPLESDTRVCQEKERRTYILWARSYLQGAEAVQTRLELLRLSIDNAEDLFTMKLDIARNRLITADTIFTLLSMIVASGALVAGFFGMNLTQGQASFITVVASTLVICVLLSVFIFITLIRSNTLVF